MFTVKKDSLAYSCSVVSVCDALLLDTSYQNSIIGDVNCIIDGDNRIFVVNRFEKALRSVIDIFGDAYVFASLYIDEDGTCGFSVMFSDRIIADNLHKMEALDTMITDYIVSFIKNDWEVLLRGIPATKISNEALWKSVNSLFSYKNVPSYKIKEV